MFYSILVNQTTMRLNMKHYTLEDFIIKYNLNDDEKYINDYLQSMARDCVISEMIEFKNPYFLAGPFNEKFGLLTITNHLEYSRRDLKAEAEDFYSYLSYSEGYYQLDSLIKPKSNAGNFISGCYDKNTGEPLPKESFGENVYRFMVENINSKISTLNHPHIEHHVCSKSTLRTSEVIEAILLALKNNDKDKVIASLEKTLNNMEKTTKTFMKDSDCLAAPTYERPYRLHVVGSDDASWSMSYATMNEAMSIRDKILEEPTSETINKYLVFTN